MNGTLYGTTAAGGISDARAFSPDPVAVVAAHFRPGEELGAGTVFSLDPNTGAETVLDSFGGTGGQEPLASLIDVKGTLYGTTLYGGSGDCSDYGCGTVFSINPNTGAETVLHSFKGGKDGQWPVAGLIDVDGMLYGTTAYGGAPGFGTVFSVDPKTGAEKVLYTFDGGIDGAKPLSALIDVKGSLYGTTYAGGAYGYGTVFVLEKR